MSTNEPPAEPYKFQLIGGTEVIEKFYPATESQEIPRVIIENGKGYRRIEVMQSFPRKRNK